MNPTEWKPIIGYEGLYAVSNKGEVKSLSNSKLRKEKILKPIKENNGYYAVMLSKNSVRKLFSIHRLVANAFIENPYNKPVVNHIDCDTSNNSVENLEWCTQKENVAQTWALNRGKVPNNKGRKKKGTK